MIYCGVELNATTTQLLLDGSPDVPARLPALPTPNSLWRIILSNTGVEDVEALRDARRLTDLHLRNTLVEDLRPLAALESLEHLYLDGAVRVRDLRPLARLPRLRVLGFERTGVVDAAVVDEIPTLRWVGFAIPPPGPFGWVRGAVRIDIANQPVADLSPLVHADRLESLRAARSAVTDLSPLRGLGESLREVDISHTRVRDLAPLAELWNLQRLYIADTDVADLAPLRGHWLGRFDAIGTRITDVGAVLTPSLRVLRLGGTRISPVPDLRALTQLRRLDVAHLDVGDLGILGGQRLRVLEIGHTGIRDLSPLAPGLLERLDLRWTPAPLAPLQAHRRTLHHLAVDIDRAPELPALAGTQITHLTIEGRGQDAVDARWVVGLRHLEELVLIDCTLPQPWPLHRLRNLRRLVARVGDAAALAAVRTIRPRLQVT